MATTGSPPPGTPPLSAPRPATSQRWPPRARLDAALGRYDAAADGYRAVVARYPLPAYVIAYGDVLQAAGRHAAAQREYALVRAEEQLYAANGVDVDVELALFDADHGGDPAAGGAPRRSRSRRQRTASPSGTRWAGRCTAPAGSRPR